MNYTKDDLSFIETLELVYGKPNSVGFGSSVFFEVAKPNESLAAIALDNYKLFMGKKWTAETEAVWMSAWKLVYERSTGTGANILYELNNIKDANAKRSVPLLTEFVENVEQGKLALAAAYNHPDISQVQVYSIGDNAEMAGLLLCGLFLNQSVCSVICLMD